MGDKETIPIYLGKLEDIELRNIVRELKDILRPYETISPGPIMRMTRDTNEQYTIHLNQRALRYIIRHIKDVPATVPFFSENEKRAAMPPDFLQ